MSGQRKEDRTKKWGRSQSCSARLAWCPEIWRGTAVLPPDRMQVFDDADRITPSLGCVVGEMAHRHALWTALAGAKRFEPFALSRFDTSGFATAEHGIAVPRSERDGGSQCVLASSHAFTLTRIFRWVSACPWWLLHRPAEAGTPTHRPAEAGAPAQPRGAPRWSPGLSRSADSGRANERTGRHTDMRCGPRSSALRGSSRLPFPVSAQAVSLRRSMASPTPEASGTAAPSACSPARMPSR
jgi:hypothetical protein